MSEPLFPPVGPPSSPGEESTRVLNKGDVAAVPPADAGKIGPYRLVKSLGEGGMGQVLLCFDDELRRPVAIKLIRRELVQNDAFLQRFLREARLTAQLNHPNIVQTYQVGRHNEAPYLVLEYVRGHTLRELLRTPPPMRIATILDIFGQTCDGLGAAAAARIVHRDVKPANIMVTKDDVAKVMDFGLSKSTEPDGITITNTVLGTPEYMSPEQAQGLDVDFRTDIYALGISLFQCVTGYLPFIGTSVVDTVMKHQRDPLPHDANLNAIANGRLARLIERMTAKAPADRPSSYIEIRKELDAIRSALGSRAEGLTTVLPPDAFSSPPPSDGTPQFEPRAAKPETPRTPGRSTRIAKSSRKRTIWHSGAFIVAGIAVVGGLVTAGLFAAGAFKIRTKHPPPTTPSPSPSPTPATPPNNLPVGVVPFTYRTRGVVETAEGVLGSLKPMGLNVLLEEGVQPGRLPIVCSFNGGDPNDALYALAMVAGWRVTEQEGIHYIGKGEAGPLGLVRRSYEQLDRATLPMVSVDTTAGGSTLRDVCEAIRKQSAIDYIIAGDALARRPVPNFAVTQMPMPRVLDLVNDQVNPFSWTVARGILIIVPGGPVNRTPQ